MTEPINFDSNNIVATIPDEQLEKLAEVVIQDHLSDQEIAKSFGMSKPTLYKLKKTERFQIILKRHGEIAVRQADARIQAAADRAVLKLLELLDCDNLSLQLKAAAEVLRLSGIGQPLPIFTPANDQNSDTALVVKYLEAISTTSGKQP